MALVSSSILLTLPAIPATTPGARPASRDAFEGELAAKLRAGDTTGVRDLIRHDPVLTTQAIEVHLARHARAAAGLEESHTLATLAAAEGGDSLCLRMVAWHAELEPSIFPRLSDAWQRFFEVQRYYDVSEWKRALGPADSLVKIAAGIGDPYLEKNTVLLAGSCRSALGRYREALPHLERALALSRALGDRISEGRALRAIVQTRQLLNEIDNPRDALEDVLVLSRRTRDWHNCTSTLNAIGVHLAMAGKEDSSRICFDEALAIARDHQLPAREAQTLINLASLLRRQGFLDESVQSLEAGLAAARRSEGFDRRQELMALVSMAAMNRVTERYSRSLAVLHEALPLADELGTEDISAEVRYSIGDTYRLLRRHQEAERYFSGALPVARRLELPTLEAAILRAGALSACDQGDTMRTRALLADALEAAQRSGSALRVAMAMGDVGWLDMMRGETSRAGETLARAAAIADTLGQLLVRCGIESSRAQLFAARGEDDSARVMFDRALATARAARTPRLLGDVLLLAARYRKEQGDLAGADTLLVEAVGLAEESRSAQSGDEFRVGFLAGRQSLYLERIAVLHARIQSPERKPSDPGAALETFERAHGRALLDAMRGARLAPRKIVSDELRGREHALAARLSAVQIALARAVAREEWSISRVDSLQNVLAETARDYRRTLDAIAVSDPAFEAATGARPPLGADEIRRAILKKSGVLLEYLAGSRESYVLLLSDDRLELARIPMSSDSLSQRVAAFRSALNGTGAEDADRAKTLGVELYRLLIAPIGAMIPAESWLLVVPDGPLHCLPFAALRDSTGYLVEHHAIRHSPSASLLDPALRRASERRRPMLVAVGNPASYREHELLADARGDMRGGDQDGERDRGRAEEWRFGPLPFADEEARRVARYFARSSVLTGGEATEEIIKTKLPAASHAHFATHGVLNQDEPLLSGLVLAQDDDGAEDGYLQVHEILRMQLDADLIALSACNTGLGETARGEGVLGLTRAFLYAGARSLVISLWQIGDRPTLHLMDTFYAHYAKRGLPAAEALRSAQLAAIASGAPPGEWAGFIFVGEAPLAGRSPWPALPWMVVTGALVCMVGVIAFRIRSSRHRS